jgi:hypothetical protein
MCGRRSGWFRSVAPRSIPHVAHGGWCRTPFLCCCKWADGVSSCVRHHSFHRGDLSSLNVHVTRRHALVPPSPWTGICEPSVIPQLDLSSSRPGWGHACIPYGWASDGYHITWWHGPWPSLIDCIFAIDLPLFGPEQEPNRSVTVKVSEPTSTGVRLHALDPMPGPTWLHKFPRFCLIRV